MRKITYLQGITEAIAEEMDRDPTVYLMGQCARGQPFGTHKGLYDKFGGWRVLDAPVSEYAIVGSAIGAALAGYRPVVDMLHAEALSRMRGRERDACAIAVRVSAVFRTLRLPRWEAAATVLLTTVEPRDAPGVGSSRQDAVLLMSMPPPHEGPKHGSAGCPRSSRPDFPRGKLARARGLCVGICLGGDPIVERADEARAAECLVALQRGELAGHHRTSSITARIPSPNVIVRFSVSGAGTNWRRRT